MPLHVDSFGAVGDGITDDARALQAAIDQAGASGQRLELGSRTYCVHSELVVRQPTHLVGEGFSSRGTEIAAWAPMRSVLHVESRCDMERILVDGNARSENGITCAGAGLSSWDNVYVRNTLGDGILMHGEKDDGGVGINDHMAMRQITAHGCGRAWADPSMVAHVREFLPYEWQCVSQPLTASIAAGSDELSAMGVDLEALDLRPGDLVAMGWDPAKKRWSWRGSVWEVIDATRVIISGASLIAVSGPAVILRGDGYSDRNGGVSRIDQGLFRSCAGHGMAFGGLYGPNCDGQMIDYCAGGGVRVGTNGAFGCYAPAFRSQYFEAIGGCKYTLLTGLDVQIDSPMDAGDMVPDVWYPAGPPYVRGIYRGAFGLHPLGSNGHTCRLGAP